MKLLAVLMILFFYRNWQGENPLQARFPFHEYQSWFVANHWPANIRYLLCVGLPVLLVAWLSMTLSGMLLGLFWLVLAVLTLVYVVDVLDTEVLFDSQVLWLREVTSDHEMAEVAQRQEDFELTLVYDLFQSIVPTLFWFLLLGPAGALFYALTARYLDNLADDDPEVLWLDTLLHWVEWIPARINSLVFALVGNFGPSFDQWVSSVLDAEESNPEHLTRIASIAIDAPDEPMGDDVVGFARLAQDHVQELRALVERSFYGWVAIAAVVVILGW